MTKQELVEKLIAINKELGADPEAAHDAADRALLAWIDDPEVTEFFNAIDKWYA